jgi:hypothetical protein
MTTMGSGELPERVCDEVDFMVRVAPVRPDGSKGLLGRLKCSEHEKSFRRSQRKNPLRSGYAARSKIQTAEPERKRFLAPTAC